MRKLLHLVVIAATVPFFGACTKSVERAQRDVQRAHDRAAQDVERKQRDLEETKQDAADRIARQERRVEDAARRGNEEITKEQRDLNDAQRAEARHEINDVPRSNGVPPAAPRIDDRSATTQPPARVDVNINRGPGGVKVDVNRNP